MPEINLFEKCLVDDKPLFPWQKVEEIGYVGFGTNCEDCLTMYEVNGLTGKVYVRKRGSSDYVCKDDGSVIISERVSHSVFLGPDTVNFGTGEVVKADVPYCPKCEKRPNSHGSPITVDEAERGDLKMLKRFKENSNL